MPVSYDRYLGPAVFAPFAADLAHRISGFAPRQILELAAATGLVTRESLPANRAGAQLKAPTSRAQTGSQLRSHIAAAPLEEGPNRGHWL